MMEINKSTAIDKLDSVEMLLAYLEYESPEWKSEIKDYLLTLCDDIASFLGRRC